MISVIIPVYNAEKYIARCLDSIISQTYTDLEIICIDDGSTDNSSHICKEYEKKDKRVHYHYIQNGGVSNARNYALKLVSGEWFAYVDSDDWLEPVFYEVLLSNATKYGCDVSACQYQMNNKYKSGYAGSTDDIYIFHNPEECIHSYICNDNSLQGQVWNKIYKTDRFRDTMFDKAVRINEDCLYTYEIMSKCNCACVCKAQLYHWYIRDNSACHSKSTAINLDAANVFLDLYNKTEAIHNIEVSNTLKVNYVNAILKALSEAKKVQKDAEVINALATIKTWKKSIWSKLDYKSKLKYYYVRLKYIV